MSALAACAGTSGMEAANADEASAQMAMATLQAPDGTARGAAQAIETDSGVKLTITGENLPAGSHGVHRSEEHTSELQSLMRISYAVFCLKNKKMTPVKTVLKIMNDHNCTHTTMEHRKSKRMNARPSR